MLSVLPGQSCDCASPSQNCRWCSGHLLGCLVCPSPADTRHCPSLDVQLLEQGGFCYHHAHQCREVLSLLPVALSFLRLPRSCLCPQVPSSCLLRAAWFSTLRLLPLAPAFSQVGEMHPNRPLFFQSFAAALLPGSLTYMLWFPDPCVLKPQLSHGLVVLTQRGLHFCPTGSLHIALPQPAWTADLSSVPRSVPCLWLCPSSVTQCSVLS